MFHKKNDVPDYVKRSAKYKSAQKEAKAQRETMSPKTKKVLLIALCAVLLVAIIGLAVWLFVGSTGNDGDGGQAKPFQSGKFDPSLGVPDADIEAFIRERYERVAAVTATFDAKVTEFDIKHNIVENQQDLVTVVATVESEICKKTFQLDLDYRVSDESWNLESGNESVVSTNWNKENLLGWWTGGTTAETFRELFILDIDLENRRASFYNLERQYSNERIYQWNTGELEILPSNDIAPYVIDYDGMKWASGDGDEQMMFPFEAEPLMW